MDIENLSKAELQALRDTVNARLHQVEEYENEELERKRRYHLMEVDQQYKENYYKMWKLVRSYVSDKGVIDSNMLDEIYQKSLEPIPIDLSKVYACPMCGSASLYVGIFDICNIPMKSVTCSSCSFVSPYYDVSDDDAWDSFHTWLIENGYLDEEDDIV